MSQMFMNVQSHIPPVKSPQTPVSQKFKSLGSIHNPISAHGPSLTSG
ncbi:protein of unknown function [Pseudomonas sp. JV241A]|nr:protein of unknown function [Pseudomonas sp. JV241A]